MKKILIIGSKGMLGQELVETFRNDNGYKVIAWDKNDIDITKEKEVMKKINFTKPDLIINAAAYNAVDRCEEDKNEFETAKNVNGLAPGYLAAAAKKNKAVLVHYSTDQVFDGEPEIPEPKGCTHSCGSCSLHQDFVPEIGFVEGDEPNPLNKYAKTKLMGEKAVAKNMKNYYIIRLAHLFGKPASSKNAKKGFFEAMIEKGKAGEVLRLVDDESGNFTYAPDLAKKTKEIIDAEKPFGIYHITNGGYCTFYEAVVELYKQAKIKTKIIPVLGEELNRPAKRPFFPILINTKLNPLRNWKDALKEYLKSANKKH